MRCRLPSGILTMTHFPCRFLMLTLAGAAIVLCLWSFRLNCGGTTCYEPRSGTFEASVTLRVRGRVMLRRTYMYPSRRDTKHNRRRHTLVYTTTHMALRCICGMKPRSHFGTACSAGGLDAGCKLPWSTADTCMNVACMLHIREKQSLNRGSHVLRKSRIGG